MTTPDIAMKKSRVPADLIEIGAMFGLLVATVSFFTVMAPGFFSPGIFTSMAYQLPELGILTLAMLLPILSGGLNLAVTFTANVAGLVAAWILVQVTGDASAGIIIVAILAALATGALIGAAVGALVAYTGAHPILVSLGFMILLRGAGEWFTRGGDISGMPEFFRFVGHGTLLYVPVPLIIFIAAVALWVLVLHYTRLGFSIYMIGSNAKAALYSGIDVARVQITLYALSGLMSAVAGIVMLSRFNSVRIGHGESYLLITILACFLAGANPFGGFGRVLPVALGLVSLQVISSGLNLMGVSQHFATATWGIFLILVMVIRAPFQQR